MKPTSGAVVMSVGPLGPFSPSLSMHRVIIVPLAACLVSMLHRAVWGRPHHKHVRDSTLVSDWVQTLIVGIETEARTSATCSMLALGRALVLLTAGVASSRALAADCGNGVNVSSWRRCQTHLHLSGDYSHDLSLVGATLPPSQGGRFPKCLS